MMHSLSMHKFLLAKAFWRVSRSEFTDALAIMERQLTARDKNSEQEPDRKPSLSILFYKASKRLHEDPSLNTPILVGMVNNINNVPSTLWRNSDLIIASLKMAATDKKSEIIATICLGDFDRNGERNRREMRFQVDPHYVGEKIGNHFLNEESRFTFWSKGIRP